MSEVKVVVVAPVAPKAYQRPWLWCSWSGWVRPSKVEIQASEVPFSFGDGWKMIASSDRLWRVWWTDKDGPHRSALCSLETRRRGPVATWVLSEDA